MTSAPSEGKAMASVGSPAMGSYAERMRMSPNDQPLML
jgi:hypothetical protein